MADIVPYSFSITTLPETRRGRARRGVAQGVYIVLPADYERILSKITNWFRDRVEVVLTDHGTSDKRGLGYIILEWYECDVDPLFLAILREEEAVMDYTVYTRDL